MLSELRIRNFAIIDSLALPLGPGFNVLSGETGAGKSIIVGALGLLLGDRATADMIRSGADRATVEGVFDVSDRPAIRATLDARGVEVEDGLVVLKREVAPGRARAWVNGTAVNATLLAELGRELVSLHGQHEAQTLTQPEAQRRILDAFAASSELVDAVRDAHAEATRFAADLVKLRRRLADAERRSDYLRHVVSEISEARVVAGEDARLEDEARRLENADELRTLAAGLTTALSGEEESLSQRLDALARPLANLQRLDPPLARLQETFDAVYYGIESLARELEAYQESVELDPARLEEVRRRRDVLFRLAKKYGGSLDAVLATLDEARAELELVDTADAEVHALESRERAARAALVERATALTQARAEAADRLARAVDEVLPDLGMADGHVTVALRPLEAIGSNGAEDVEFCVALNVGHDARPLSRVASGGELSRVMLALETILARVDDVPTLVFDEVDAGIGGRVGLQVGETMRRVAGCHQVFAITHLPQLAARAHQHIVVSKGARGGITTADVTVLDGDARVAEIARMLGGDAESSVSRAHAAELLQNAAVPAMAGIPAGRSDRESSVGSGRRSPKQSRGG